MVHSLSFTKILRSIRRWGKVHRIRRSSVSCKKIPSSFEEAYRRIISEWGRLIYHRPESSDATAKTGEVTTTTIDDRCGPDVERVPETKFKQEIREEKPFLEQVTQKSFPEFQSSEIFVDGNAEQCSLTDRNAATEQESPVPTSSPSIQPSCPTPSLRLPVSQQFIEAEPTADVLKQSRPSTNHQLGYILSLLTQIGDQNQRQCSLEEFVVQI